MSALLAALLLAYLIGALPSAALVARLRGKSIFDVGSGNMGAMNTGRNLGLLWGALVLLLDVGKGAVAVFLGGSLAALAGAAGPWAVLSAYAAGVGAVCGHAWSVYVGFRGGKALAVTLGASLMLFPLAGLATAGILLVLVALINATVASAIAAALLAPVLYLTGPGTALQGTAALWSAALMAVIILVKHWPALQALRQQQD